MNRYRIKKSQLNGHITIPASKSQTLRALLFGSLGSGKSIIHQYLRASDTNSMIEACRLFGAAIHVSDSTIEIDGTHGVIRKTEDVIYAGNSGIILRFCAGVGALAPNPVVITGDYSIRHQRPMQPLLNALTDLGASAVSMRGDGYAPVIIQGPIKPGTAELPGEDSQPVSALLIASAFASGEITINVKNPGEKPWVTLTLDWFDRLRIPYTNHAFERYHLYGNARHAGFEYSVPGDASSAAFPIAAAIITQSELTICNIDMEDLQGDKELIAVFQQMGANLEIDHHKKTIQVHKTTHLSGRTVDINNFIDAVTILAVVACFAQGETVIQNASVARQKECNRIHCIATELRKMGADITETEDGLRIKPSILRGAEVHSHYDHRMAMSLAVAAMGAIGETCISSVECVSKSFPSFVRDFQSLGANIVESA